MAEQKKTTEKVGDLIEVKKTVVRPDGEEVTVTGGQYLLTEKGSYVVDGKEVEVK